MDKMVILMLGVLLGFAVTAYNTFMALECYRAIDTWALTTPTETTDTGEK